MLHTNFFMILMWLPQQFRAPCIKAFVFYNSCILRATAYTDSSYRIPVSGQPLEMAVFDEIQDGVINERILPRWK